MMSIRAELLQAGVAQLLERPCVAASAAIATVRRPRSLISCATSSTRVGPPPGDDDVRAGIGEPEREHAADAARTADDDRRSAGQIEEGHQWDACRRRARARPGLGAAASLAGGRAIVGAVPAIDTRWPATDVRASPGAPLPGRARESPGRSGGASPRRRADRDRWRGPPSHAAFRSRARTPSRPARRRSGCPTLPATLRWKLMSCTRNTAGSSSDANRPATSSASVAI